MWRLLLNAASVMLPLYVVAILYSEVAAYLAARRLAILALWASGAIGAIVLLQYWAVDPSFERQSRTVLFFGVTLWNAAIPVIILTAALLFIVRMRNLVSRQLLIIALAGLAVFFWPVFALISWCASDLYCV